MADADALDVIGQIFGKNSSHNPLADDSGGAEHGTADRTREDTNAVVCSDWFARARNLLVAPDGSGTRLLASIRFLGPVLVVVYVFAVASYINEPSNLSSYDVLVLVLLFTASPTVIALTNVVSELFAVLHPNGDLAKLGIGETKISASEMAVLQRQRQLTRFVQLFSVGSGIAGFSMINFTLIKGLSQGSIGGLKAFLGWLPMFWLVPAFLWTTLPLACEFALSLQVAAALTSDSVLEVVHVRQPVHPSAALHASYDCVTVNCMYVCMYVCMSRMYAHPPTGCTSGGPER
eukprot:COSAG01_NODE_10885_length_2060_cov_48.003570_2_plen_291_part_00